MLSDRDELNPEVDYLNESLYDDDYYNDNFDEMDM